jgi:hypothetical protein
MNVFSHKYTQHLHIINHSAHLFTWTTFTILYKHKFNILRVHEDLFAVQMFTPNPVKVHEFNYLKFDML